MKNRNTIPKTDLARAINIHRKAGQFLLEIKALYPERDPVVPHLYSIQHVPGDFNIFCNGDGFIPFPNLKEATECLRLLKSRYQYWPMYANAFKDMFMDYDGNHGVYYRGLRYEVPDISSPNPRENVLSQYLETLNLDISSQIIQAKYPFRVYTIKSIKGHLIETMERGTVSIDDYFPIIP